MLYSLEGVKWADGLEFIKDVPVSWDETRTLQADIGQYIVSARRKGDDWYIGAMSNEEARNLKVPLDFLGDGLYTATIWEDGKEPSSAVKRQITAKSKDKLKLSLASSGGAVVQLKKNSSQNHNSRELRECNARLHISCN